MTNSCTCKAEHWQTHAESCPAYKPRPLLTVENIRSGAIPADAVVAGFLLGEIDQLHGNLSLAEEGLANYALEVEHKNSLIDAQDAAQTSLHNENVRLRVETERLQKREKDLLEVIDSRDRALGFVPLDELHAHEPFEQPIQQLRALVNNQAASLRFLPVDMALLRRVTGESEGAPRGAGSPPAPEIERLTRISLAARALLKYLDDHDWGLIPEGQTANTLRDLLDGGCHGS